MQGFLFGEQVIMCLIGRNMRQTGLFPRIYLTFFSNVHIEDRTALHPDPDPENQIRKDPSPLSPYVLRFLEIQKVVDGIQ